MDNKELLKKKLAASVSGVDTSNAPQIREALQSILDNGLSADAELIKSAAKRRTLGKAIKNYFSQSAVKGKDGLPTGKFTQSGFQRDSATVKDVLALGAALGGAGMAIGKGVKGLRDARRLSKMTPFQRAMKKNFGKDTLGRKVLTFGAGAAGIAGGIKGIEALGDAAIKPLQKRKAFNNMMEDNPGLKKEKPKDVKRVFNTLFRFNPKMAADPLVAGSFMKRTLQFKEEGIQPVDVKTLTEVGRNMSSNKASNSLLSAAFLGGAKDLAGFAG